GEGPDKRLIAYTVPHGNTDTSTSTLRQFLSEQLPDYMVPAVFVELERLPLTLNGKVDRKALPEPDLSDAAAGAAPRSAAEEIMRGLFEDVLGVAGVGVHDDFFELGGHSLMATQLIGRIRSALGVEMPLRVLFEARTVAGVCARLEEGGTARPAVAPVERPGVVPLSFAQQRLWFLDRLDERRGVYNVPLVHRLGGAVDRDALEAALADVVERHETLRTVFPERADRPYQRVLDPDEGRPVLVTSEVPASQIDHAVAEACACVFDLTRELPVRAWLFTSSPDDHVLVVVVHHVASDGWSLAPLTRDLATAYRARLAGRAPSWPALPVQYVDYTLWQRELLGDEDDPDSVLARQTNYWRTQLAGVPEELALPVDRARPAVATHHGADVPFHLDRDLHAGLTRLARESQVTMFMVLQGLLAALLTRLGAGTDIPLGTPVAGRNDEALDELVGFFVNTLVLRTDTGENPTFRDLLTRIRDTDLTALAHQDIPFEHLVEALNPARSLARHPLFQVMFAFQNTTGNETRLEGLSTTVLPAPTTTAKFDLTFEVLETHDTHGQPDGIAGRIEYATDLFDQATITTLAERLTLLATAALTAPDTPIGDLPVLTPEEQHRILTHWNDTTTTHPHTRPIHHLIEEQAARTPDHTAVTHATTHLTYRQLNERANQ
ncbi:condensation domain-containing protein, partial [Kitasatospora sp. NPDC057198]|uniref:condensation domain-containing protein n=1 Tax=Kitasatospora sp. NPDC057198 TaxID=3346046 RepID=UPI00362A4C0E